ncbi:MAG: iron-sulfur cluster assembly accessory protein [Fimbriimonadaceae bacterium]|nr:iron-sulfur cluster assembly accessory protein [Fimbriimonadaceae bacterium]
MSIILTERAVCELKDLMISHDQAGSALRVGVHSGGCSGFQYQLALDAQEPESDDHVIEHEGIKVLVDAFSMVYLTGATIDYVDDPLGGGFKIENPNSVGGCGCGNSFRTEEGSGGGGCCGGGCGSR